MYPTGYPQPTPTQEALECVDRIYATIRRILGPRRYEAWCCLMCTVAARRMALVTHWPGEDEEAA